MRDTACLGKRPISGKSLNTHRTNVSATLFSYRERHTPSLPFTSSARSTHHHGYSYSDVPSHVTAVGCRGDGAGKVNHKMKTESRQTNTCVQVRYIDLANRATNEITSVTLQGKISSTLCSHRAYPTDCAACDCVLAPRFLWASAVRVEQERQSISFSCHGVTVPIASHLLPTCNSIFGSRGACLRAERVLVLMHLYYVCRLLSG